MYKQVLSMKRSSGKYLVLLMQVFIVCIVFIFPASVLYIFVFLLYSGESIEAQYSDSELSYPPKPCLIYERDGSHEKTAQAGRYFLKTKSGLSFMLKTPLDYKAGQAYPMLIVFSPVLNATFMERYTGLTALATSLGFIIVYVDGIKLNLKTIPQLVEIYETVNQQWCVDSENIFLAGHSDGATAAQALAFLPDINLPIKGFISSAAGIQFADLQAHQCPDELNVILLHNKNDTHFPDYGSNAVKWWAACNQCNQEKRVYENGCWSYQECVSDVQTVFCEQPGTHLKWPGRQQEIKNFLKQGLMN